MNQSPHPKEAHTFPIVGIGASAGGLEAVSNLLQALPADTGMGFVVVQHMDPGRKSILADLLVKTTSMPVQEAKHNAAVEPNHVYVIPHDKDMTIAGGTLCLSERTKSGNLHMPIDQFFRSLAQDCGSRAIGIILSGTASDGTAGFGAIKDEEAGVTFAQDETAAYQGMPKAAIDSGKADFVLAPADIAKQLATMSSHPYLAAPAEEAPGAREEPPIAGETAVKKIFALLQRNTKLDFSHYKTTTTQRRIRRRMLLNGFTGLEGYLGHLQENSSEIDALHGDLLINVTSFFRDPDTVQALKDEVFPSLVKDRPVDQPIRIWVPGCAGGQEAYSTAMALSEFLSEQPRSIPMQVFGTDVSKAAIDKARSGLYSKEDAGSVSPERLERFFTKSGDNYQISKSIREVCIFAPQNVFADPPFSRLDIISCCNLLIYLEADLQQKIIRTFQYALKPAGYLVLGKSETVGNSAEQFSQIDKKRKIYTRKEAGSGRGTAGFGAIAPRAGRPIESEQVGSGAATASQPPPY